MASNSVLVLSTCPYAIHTNNLYPTIEIAGLKPTNIFIIYISWLYYKLFFTLVDFKYYYEGGGGVQLFMYLYYISDYTIKDFIYKTKFNLIDFNWLFYFYPLCMFSNLSP